MFNKLIKVKYIQIIQMDVFTVATAESDDAIVVNGCCRMKSFRLKVTLPINKRIQPFITSKIKCPQII